MVSNRQPCQLILCHGKGHGHWRPLHSWNGTMSEGHRMLRSIDSLDGALGTGDCMQPWWATSGLDWMVNAPTFGGEASLYGHEQ